MDNEEKNNSTNEGKSTSEESINESNAQSIDDAGPSGWIALPGTVNNPKKTFPTQPGISKSEHSIRHIITNKDVTNALRSLSFGAPTQTIKNLNLKELKIPIMNDETIEKDDSTTLIDLKKFMASCFKLTKEPANVQMALNELTRPTVPTVVSSVKIELPDPPDVTNLANNIPIEAPVPKTNEIIVTKTVDPKTMKTGTEKKKTSGTFSERSDLGVAPRDSLSSIGSNVCRICMTRGRERLVKYPV